MENRITDTHNAAVTNLVLFQWLLTSTSQVRELRSDVCLWFVILFPSFMSWFTNVKGTHKPVTSDMCVLSSLEFSCQSLVCVVKLFSSMTKNSLPDENVWWWPYHHIYVSGKGSIHKWHRSKKDTSALVSRPSITSRRVLKMCSLPWISIHGTSISSLNRCSRNVYLLLSRYSQMSWYHYISMMTSYLMGYFVVVFTFQQSWERNRKSYC